MSILAAPSAFVAPSLGSRLHAWLADKALILSLTAAIFIVWEIAVRTLKVPTFVFPPPSEIAVRMATDWRLLVVNGWASLREILLGFALSVMVGVPLAVAIVYSRVCERVAYPFLVSLQTVPKVALAPILVMWFGYGLLPKVLVAFLISFFPIVISAVIGMRSVEREMIYLVRSMGATPLQTFVSVRLPKAMPSIFGGLKVGMGQAVIGAVVGEFIAAEEGLGYIQLIAQQRIDTPLLFAAVAALALIGVALFNLIAWLETALMPWQRLVTEHAE